MSKINKVNFDGAYLRSCSGHFYISSSRENGRIVTEEKEKAAQGLLKKLGGKGGQRCLKHPPFSFQSNQWLCSRASVIHSGIAQIKFFFTAQSSPKYLILSLWMAIMHVLDLCHKIKYFRIFSVDNHTF